MTNLSFSNLIGRDRSLRRTTFVYLRAYAVCFHTYGRRGLLSLSSVSVPSLLFVCQWSCKNRAGLDSDLVPINRNRCGCEVHGARYTLALSLVLFCVRVLIQLCHMWPVCIWLVAGELHAPQCYVATELQVITELER